MRKHLLLVCVVVGVSVAGAGPAFSCGALIGPRGSVNLSRTTTLAAHHWGVEHYITAFTYEGGGGRFGSIVPLPAMPSKIEKGGAWTLQRLQRETQPAFAAEAVAGRSASTSGPAVVYETHVDALDLKVLRGGGRAVGEWAVQHGFRLPPDTPAVLDFYASRSPYFLVAVFDSKDAQQRGTRIGDGIPIHISIPLKDPWIPLRILGLGKTANDRIDADLYLLTDRRPSLLPAAGDGYTLEREVPASDQLLKDLRTDRGMGWLPAHGMTLTHLVVDASEPQLDYDLAVNDLGGAPSRERAGLPPLATPVPTKAPVVTTPAPSAPPSFYPQALPAGTTRTSSTLPAITLSVVLFSVIGASAFVMRRRAR
jgi:hypothetical protein